MSSMFTRHGIYLITTGSIDLDADTFKLMLTNQVNTATRPLCNHDTVDMGDTNDFETKEITATNYGRGFGGSGRLSFTLSVTKITATSCANDSVVTAATKSGTLSLTWNNLGSNTGGQNDTIYHIPMIKETGGSDANSPVLAVFDLSAPITTNGGNLTVNFTSVANDTGPNKGNLQFLLKIT